MDAARSCDKWKFEQCITSHVLIILDFYSFHISNDNGDLPLSLDMTDP